MKIVLEEILTDMLEIEDEFEQYVKGYLENNPNEYEDLIREHLGLENNATITDQDKQDYLDAVVDYIKDNPAKKQEIIPTVVKFVLSDGQDIDEVINTAISEIVNDEAFRTSTIGRIAGYLEHHPEIMEEVVEFVKDGEIYQLVDTEQLLKSRRLAVL